jgi:hypothetical protein
MLTVNFAPDTQREARALSEYCANNRPVIETRKTADYHNAVAGIKQLLREYYRDNPAQLIVKQCPWQSTGATARCEAIARRYSVPYWDVVAEAAPSS